MCAKEGLMSWQHHILLWCCLIDATWFSLQPFHRNSYLSRGCWQEQLRGSYLGEPWFWLSASISAPPPSGVHHCHVLGQISAGVIQSPRWRPLVGQSERLAPTSCYYRFSFFYLPKGGGREIGRERRQRQRETE